MKKDLKTKLQEMTHDDLMLWITWIVAFAGVVLAAIFGTYFLFFFKSKLSANPEQWGQFGDFLGGTANPILGFLTLIALVLTINIQSRQLSVSSKELQLSRKELEFTRAELHRSAVAQELSEKALTAQARAADRSARLSAINFLLDHYKSELKEMRGQSFLSNDPRVSHLKALQEREQILLSMLDALFNEMQGTQEKKNGAS